MSMNILCICGSIVSTCFVKRLTHIAAAGAEASGATITGFIECEHLDVPIYTNDRERADGLPKEILAIKDLLEEADGLIVGAPEFNAGITSSLKNVIDWASRPRSTDGLPHKRSFEGVRNESFAGLTGVMVSGSKFEHGGFRGLFCLRNTLAAVGVTALPESVSVPWCSPKAFTAQTTLEDEAMQAKLEALGAMLVTELGRGASAPS